MTISRSTFRMDKNGERGLFCHTKVYTVPKTNVIADIHIIFHVLDFFKRRYNNYERKIKF